MRRVTGIGGIVAIGLAMTSTATVARADAPRFEVTPFVGYRFGGNFDLVAPEPTPQGSGGTSADLKSAASYGIDLGLYRDPNGFYEFLYGRQKAGLDTNSAALRGVDVTVEYYQLGGTAFFPGESERTIPYVSFTLGATRFSADGGNYDSETKFSASVGGGIRVPVSDNFGLNLGLRGYLTFVNSNTDFLCVSGSQGATCLLKSTGSTFFQGEAQLGFAMRF